MAALRGDVGRFDKGGGKWQGSLNFFFFFLLLDLGLDNIRHLFKVINGAISCAHGVQTRTTRSAW